MKVVRVRIEGVVQAVGFRFWTEDRAAELGLAGWVRNRRDGTVEALFAGEDGAVQAMLEACAQGPRAADVSVVKVLAEGEDAPSGFTVRATE